LYTVFIFTFKRDFINIVDIQAPFGFAILVGYKLHKIFVALCSRLVIDSESCVGIMCLQLKYRQVIMNIVQPQSHVVSDRSRNFKRSGYWLCVIVRFYALVL